MYARGMTVREIQGHLLDLYGLEVSAELVSTITDAVLETAKPAARDHLSLTSKVLIRAP
jgi:transposase-like protein